MAKFETNQLRDIVLLSHSGAGKTMIGEAMLFAAGATTRMGNTTDGTTASDYEPEEQKRQTSVQTSILPAQWKKHKINVIDTPGYADYRGEVVSGLRAADAAVLAVAAQAGVEVGTKQMWQMAEEHGLPRILFINKMDRENASYERVMASISEAFGRKCVAIQVPIGAESKFSGVVGLMDAESKAPADLKGEAESARERLMEAIAEADDELAEKYLEGKPLTRDEMAAGLRKGVLAGTIVPVMFGAAPSGKGIHELMDAIVEFLPSPAESAAPKATSGGIAAALKWDAAGPLAAFVFKTSADPFVGKLSYFKVFSGAFKSDSQVFNARKNETERIGQVFVVRGKTQETTDSLAPGDIGAVPKLSGVLTGDTLSVKEKPITIEPLKFPAPVYQMAVYPKSKADVDKMTTALARICEEDPSLVLTREHDTLEMLLCGLGDTHVEVAIEKIKRKFGAEIVLQTPKVPYKETISGRAKVEYKHKKQSGGHGQYGHVFVEVEPLPRGSGFEFAERVVGGSVPREYIPAVEKGCHKALGEGVVAGFPVVDVRATLFDGSFHPVDSSGICFEIAGSHAFANGIKQANPVILEPVMYASITVPDAVAGDVMGDLNSKRARIMGMTPGGEGMTTIEVNVPQAEMLRYATELRSQTQGRGLFTMKFDHYDTVPSNLVQRIVAQRQQRETAKV
ncbi:MAG: elongation factor G [SAR202 cluster bacterium]|nr:elongation factor G [SAR202 cluster bacterium]